MSDLEVMVYVRGRDSRGPYWNLVRALPYDGTPLTEQRLEQWLCDSRQRSGVYMAQVGEQAVQVAWAGGKPEAAVASWGGGS